MAKRVLLSGYIGFSNFGDDALLTVLLNYLKKFDCKIAALSSNVESTKSIFNIDALYYKNIFSILKGILNSDVVIQGGGNLLQNKTSFLNLIYYLNIILLSKIFFKKVVMYSQGIGPIKGKFSNFLTKNILKLVDLIIVRDIYSQRQLAEWKIFSKCSNDAVWSMDIPKYEPKNAVGIQLRNFRKFKKDFLINLAKYIDMYFSENLIKIFSFENSLDAKLCYDFEKILRKRNPVLKTKVILYKNPEETAKEFSDLKYLIAMRLHANILGLMYGIKTIPVSYDQKVTNLARQFGIEYQDAAEECNMQIILTTLTAMADQNNPKIEDARKSKFEWSHIDKFLK